MAKPELGTKRVCPTTGRKFYDLNKDPIVSPFTGEAIPRSVFEPQVKGPRTAEDEEDDESADPATISLEDADDEDGVKIDIDDDAVVEDDDDADSFLEDEEDNDDVSGLIDSDIDDEDEN